MATNPQNTISEQTDLTLVRDDRKKAVKSRRNLMGRIISTVAALAVLAVVLRYLPPGPRNAQAQTESVPIGSLTDDLQLGSLQMSVAPAGEALYLDGVVKNTGSGNVTGATVEIDFQDAQGNVVSSLQKPIASMARGGVDLVRNEFARNPIQPNEMRFFRVAIEQKQVPAAWNHEVPELKVVEVKVP
jgi:hypothetical protein